MKRAYEPKAQEFARKAGRGRLSHHHRAGNVWPEAFYYGMCILEEMQWIRTRPVTLPDFFHGTLS